MEKTSKHPGFRKVSESIQEKEDVSPDVANAILAAASRRNVKTSGNSHLKKVK
jgi:hypothetical protein